MIFVWVWFILETYNQFLKQSWELPSIETNCLHLKMDGWNMIVSFWAYFKGLFTVIFREGMLAWQFYDWKVHKTGNWNFLGDGEGHDFPFTGWCWAYIKGNSRDARGIVGPPAFPYYSHSRIPLKCGNGTGNLWVKGSSHWGVNCAHVPKKTLAEQSHSLVGDVLLMVEYPTETDIGKWFQNSHSYNNKITIKRVHDCWPFVFTPGILLPIPHCWYWTFN